MLAAAFSHGLDGSEIWPDTHLPLAMGVLWHCPERVDEMLQIMQSHGLLDPASMPVQVEAQVAGCWRVNPENTENRLTAMKWLVDNGGPGAGARMVEASIGAGFAAGVAAFWECVPPKQHEAMLQMALLMDEPATLRAMLDHGVEIHDPAVQARVIKAAPEGNRIREGARIAQLVLQAKTPAGEPAPGAQPRF